MLSWEIRKWRIIFLLKTIFRIDWVAAGRVYHRPCCQSQCYPGNGGKRKGPAAAGGSVHILAAQHGTQLLSTSCRRWAMSSQTTEKHIRGDDPFRVTTSWVLTQAFPIALLSVGILSFLAHHPHFKNEQTEAQKGCFLQSIRIKQNWCDLASGSPTIPLDVNTPPVSNLKLCGHEMHGTKRDWGIYTQMEKYLIFRDLKMSNKDSFFNLLNNS